MGTQRSVGAQGPRTTDRAAQGTTSKGIPEAHKASAAAEGWRLTVSALRRRLSLQAETAVAWGVVALIVLFVLRQLHPSLLLQDTTPATGDLAGHMNAIAQYRDEVLGHGRLAGWSRDWFTGFPAFTFYFPLPGLLASFLGLMLPLNVAVKLMAALAPLSLPLVAYAFGRLNDCNRLVSACFAVLTVPLLLQPSLFFAGGSLAASVGGEFNYGLSLASALFVVGLARAGLRTGRFRTLTAGLLAATVLMHLIPAVMAIVGVVVATVLPPARAKLRWAGPVLATAGALAAFWIVPFLVRGRFTAGSEATTTPPLLDQMLPVEIIPVVLLAIIGSGAVFRSEVNERNDLRPFLLAMVAASALVCVVMQTSRAGTGRFVATWFVWLCLLAGYGLAALARAIDDLRRKRAHGQPLGSPARARLLLPILALGALLPLYDSRDWRGPLTSTSTSFLFDTADVQFRGLERSRDRAEFNDFVETVRAVGADHGCGRAHLEVAEGTWSRLSARPLASVTPMLTDGCITFTGGLYVQSSPTFPFVDAVNSRVSSVPTGGRDAPAFDLVSGIAGLRTLGVRYLIVTNSKTAEAADASSDLRPVAQTKTYGGERFWKVYEIAGVGVVEPLRSLPVVVPGVGRSRASWEDTAKEWFDVENAREVVVAANGPATWPRARRLPERLPRQPVEATTVSRVRIDEDRVSFRVSRTGVPVLVRVSYFPNWSVSGADGPWRVTPNQMVVVPTSQTVTLRYGYTSVEYAGGLVSLLGVGGLVVLARRGPVDMPEPMPPTTQRESRPTQRPQATRKRKKRRK